MLSPLVVVCSWRLRERCNPPGGAPGLLRPAVWLSLGLLLSLSSALSPERLAERFQSGPCLDGGSACAAAAAPAGMRQVFKGQRMVRSQWVERRNRESGAPDIGLRSQWQPITVRR